MGRSQARPPIAATPATTIASGSRTRSEIGRYQPGVCGVLELVRITSIHCLHAVGSRRYDASTMAPVTPSAIASGRHSRRNANQASPIPGVTLVRIGSAQATDARKPSTIAAAYIRCTLPDTISNGIGRNSIDGIDQRPSSHHTMARLTAVQIVTNRGHGRIVSGRMSCANAGEYR